MIFANNVKLSLFSAAEDSKALDRSPSFPIVGVLLFAFIFG